MVDPFLDPLDMAPVEHPTPRARQRNDAWNQSNETFQQIFNRELEQEPTPIMMPEALQVPPINPRQPNNIPVPQNHPSLENTEDRMKFPAEVEATVPSSPESFSGIVEEATSTAAAETIKPPIENMARLMNVQVRNHPPEKPSISRNLRESSPPSDLPKNEEIMEPEGVMYTVQRGDTLSGIVLKALKKTGGNFSTGDVYQMVRLVADYNQIKNPNRIYVGNRVDLTPIYSGQTIVEEKPRQSAWTGTLQVPVFGNITSEFGSRIHPILNNEQFHTGIDISAPTGTPVLPVQPGWIAFSGEKSGYGQVVEIDHDDGTQSVYAHLSQRRVEKGDRIREGEFVGLSGDTGRSTGPHLHLEIRQNGEPVDPLLYFSRGQIENPLLIARRE